MGVREKLADKKKSRSSDRPEACFFWKPISKLVVWWIFRIFGHSVTEIQGLEGRVWSSYRHFFQYWNFKTEIFLRKGPPLWWKFDKIFFPQKYQNLHTNRKPWLNYNKIFYFRNIYYWFPRKKIQKLFFIRPQKRPFWKIEFLIHKNMNSPYMPISEFKI